MDQLENVERQRQQTSTLGLADTVGRDLRYSFRRLWRRPTFTLAAVLTLALGIGANTAVFSVVNAVLLKPLSYPQSNELVSLQHVAPGLNSGALGMSLDLYFTYRDENRTFEHLGAFTDGGATVTGVGDPEQARVRIVLGGVLQALGVQPMLGRWFSEADHAPQAAGPIWQLGNTVILTHAYWQRKFGGDPGVIGRSMSIDSRPTEIVGVMPAGFRFLNMTPEAELILSGQLDRSRVALASGFGAFQGVGRLKPGVTLADAQGDAARMLPIWLDAWPAAPGGVQRDAVANWLVAPAFVSLKDTIVGNIAGTLWVLMGTIGAVFAIACANVANLMLVRADARRQEFAVRAALGAGRGRIARELLVESTLLGALGGAAGLVLAYLGLRLLVAFGPTSLPRLQEISVDPSVLAFVVVASLVSSLLLGSIPAFKHAAPLSAARGATASRERHRARNALVVAQVALALVLIVCSGLMFRTFGALRAVDPGVSRPEAVQIARINITAAISTDPERTTQIQREILERLAAIPGVEAASFGLGAPMEGTRTPPGPLYVEGQRYEAGETAAIRRHQYVAPGYFATVGTRMVAGRDITWPDIDAGGKVAVISEGLARELWGEPAAALGKRVRESRPDAPGIWRDVIGVVQDVHEDGVSLDAPRLVYWPVLREGWLGQPKAGMPPIAYVVRSERAGTASFAAEINQAVWAVNRDLPVFLVRTVQDLYVGFLAQTSFTLVMLAIAATMALGLGVVGIYGVMAYVVSQRTREIGIRLALGAQPTELKRMFVLDALTRVAIGVVFGLVAAFALTRMMSSLLYGIDPLDAPTYLAALAVLLAAAAFASYVPARRAASIDPIETLKTE
jgi:putative ABC transport system permease protein